MSIGASFQVSQYFQFFGSWCRGGFQLVREADFPAGGFDHVFPGHIRVQGGDHQLLGLRIRLEDAQVGDHHGGAAADVRDVVPGLAVTAEANGGHEVHVLHEGAPGVLYGNEHFLGVSGNLRGATATGQANPGLTVIADQSGVQVGVAVEGAAARVVGGHCCCAGRMPLLPMAASR